MIIDIRDLRKKARITQKELASRVGLPQGTISRYETSPEIIPFPVMIDLLNALGTSIAEYSHLRSPQLALLNFGEPLRSYLERIKSVREQVEKYIEPPRTRFFAGALSANRLKGLARELDRRPNILFAGPTDAGKTTIINTILGQQKLLPATYQSTTGVVTYIRHADQKPAWLKEDVLLLGSKYDPWRWCEKPAQDDSRASDDLTVIYGNVQTFKDYCTADGKHWKENPIRSAHVFLDAPVLKCCNMIDMPGFDSELLESFADATNDFSYEVLVYASPFNGFLRRSEVFFLFELVKQLRVLPDINGLDPLYILISHASRSGVSDDDIKYLKARASSRLYSLSNYEVFPKRSMECAPENRKAPDAKIIEERMFTFWQEDPERKSEFIDDLGRLLAEKIVAPWSEAVRLRVLEACQESDRKLDKLREYCLRIRNMKTPGEKESATLIESEQARRKRLLRSRSGFTKRMDKIHLQFCGAFEGVFSEVFCQPSIEETLSNTEDPAYAADTVLFLLLNKVKEKSEEIRLELYDEIEHTLNDVLEITADVPFVFRGGFNSSDAFLFGIERETGFAYNVSYNQPIANDPGDSRHSVVADPKLLESDLLDFPLSRSIMPVDSIVAVAETIHRIAPHGSNWRRLLAKKTMKIVSENNLLESITSFVRKQFDDAVRLYLAGIDEVIIHWKDFFRTQNALFTNYDKASRELDNLLDTIRDSRAFFEKVPPMLKS